MKYDAIVIGAGQAGTPLSFALADQKWNVALVENRNLGGTCINTGCTPTKTMIHRAQVAYYARNAKRWGVIARDVGVDLPTIVGQKNHMVEGYRQGLQKGVDSRPNLHLFHGAAQFTGPKQIKVGNEVLESDRFFINAGERPKIPQIPGLDAVHYLTNETIMELKVVPDHLLVLGGGYIGLEFGQMFARFGSRVTVIHHVGQILSQEDPEIAAELQRALEAESIRFLLNARTTRVEEKKGAITLVVGQGNASFTVTGSHLLVATGRRPNTEGLALDRAGVALNPDATIKVNSRLETSVPGIWALGDIKGGPAFTHISYNDFQIVYADLCEGKNLSTDGRIVPYCVFTDPQLGGVGLTEKEARSRGYKLKIGRVPMTSVARARERDETAGLMKIVVDAANDRILGASFLATDGGETIHIVYTLMLAGAPYTVLKGAVYIHPTLAEGLFYLMDDVKAAPAEAEVSPRAIA
jgi:pyruvate/2-oxoglutarate dehydrogenase complex dihydrolipoamide dehydrogenase (E3) component